MQLGPALMLLAALFAGVGLAASGAGARAAGDEDPQHTIRVTGNAFVNGTGRPLRFSGVNRSGTEYVCAQGTGIFDGPSDDASVRAIASWPLNAVRVPLNESCWLGTGGVPAAYSGAAYRAAIVDYVATLRRYGLFAELSLVYVTPGDGRATSQLPMPDADHSPDFWRSVAATFRDDGAVLFGVYGSPHDVSWSCWRDGGAACSTGYRAAGMQTLVDAVRSTGATQPIAVSGIGWGNDLTRWLRYRPADKRGALVAEAHVHDHSACADVTCWRTSLLAVAARVPVVTAEVGQSRCQPNILDSYIPFARANGISYIAWTWNVSAGCSALIASYQGVPSAYGFVYQEQLHASPGPPTAPLPATPPPDRSVTGLLIALALALALIGAGGTAFALRRRRSGSRGPTGSE